MKKLTWQEKARLIQVDPSASYWLQQAVKDLLLRDPVNVANETEFLSGLMRERMLEIMKSASVMR